MTDEESNEIKFLAHKVHVHHWPPETPKWSDSRKTQVDEEINQNKKDKQIQIKNQSVSIENYEFLSIKKVGITIPLFKKQCTMIFEGHCQEFDAHVHITTKEKNYLETFNKLMHWREKFFPEL